MDTLNRLRILLGILALAIASACLAQQAPFESAFSPDRGKLPLTAGFTDIDGAGGAGLVPFALVTGYGTDQSWGANAHYTYVPLRDFRLQSYGVAVGLLDRVEASFTIDRFQATSAPLDGLTVQQKVFGLKAVLFGDAVYGQDSWLPQTAIGLQYRRNSGISDAGSLTSPRQVGARAESGIDYYLVATKVFLAQSLLVNAGLRFTNANEFGILGFGGDLRSGHSVEFQGTLAYLLTRTVAVGAEYRGRPHNLAADDENGAYDAFIAWTLSRNISLVGAVVRLGRILSPVTASNHDQVGGYVSLQVGF